MAQRNPARLMKAGAAIRYDVVWTLPFSEFARIGYYDTQTWWVDSFHGNEIAAKKRFAAIADCVAGSNGAAVLLEIMTNPKNPSFSQRVIARSGHNYTPPPVSEIEPMTVPINLAFKELRSRWEARNRHRLQVSDLPTRAVRKRKNSNAGAWAVACSAAAVIGTAAVIGWFNSSAPTPRGGGVNGFGARTVADSSETRTVHERPTQRIYLRVEGERGVCEISTMGDRGGYEYLGKGPCPGR